MIATEYDLLVAHDRFMELQDEMRAINMARRVQTESAEQPTILDRLIGMFHRGAHIHAPSRKVGAAA